MKLNIPTSSLLAAQMCSAKEDIRWFINGVLVDIVSSTKAFIVSTTGATLFAGKITGVVEDYTGPVQITIPNDVLKKAITRKNSMNHLESTLPGKFTINGKEFVPIQGKFPDYRRVIPKSVSGDVGDYDPELVLAAVKAVATYYGTKLPHPARFIQNGRDAAVAVGLDNSAVAVVMPWSFANCVYSGLVD